MIYELLIIPV